MRERDVPQDTTSFYRGIQRACYAVDEDGNYVIAASRGWDTEKVVTEQALLQLEEEVEDVRQRVAQGELAPLAYHLATHMMTPKLCAQHLGVAAWRVKRHLKPRVFEKLSDAWLARYAAVLDMPVEELARVAEGPRHVFLQDSDD